MAISRPRRPPAAFGCAVIALLGIATASAQVVLPPGLGQAGGQTAPGPGYDAALEALAAGSYAAARDLAARDYTGGVKFGAQRWIDSIASAAVLGECHYELGNLREAIAAYEESLLMATNHPEWLLAVQFPPQPPRPAGQRVATWGRSGRNAAPAILPAVMTIRRGGSDPEDVLKNGGVLSAPADYPIRPQEIMRSLVIALYRHADILGPLANTTAVQNATKVLARRPAPPNHYSQSWIDVALGTAYWVQGKSDLALPLLNRGLLIGDGFDHPLTSWGLIVLGRIALDADQAPVAASLFEEATYTAADFGDVRALEEAFRLAFTAHMIAGTRGVPPTIGGGCAWARTTLPVLRANLLAMQAESLAAAGDLRAAEAAVREIDGRLLRGDPGRGTTGALAAYAAAVGGDAAGDTGAADDQLGRALALARARSPRLFPTQRLVEALLAGTGSISDREADILFAKLLGDPTPRQFAADPLDTLAVITAPRGDAFETWVAVAGRRSEDALLEAAEATARHRWLATQPLGGRRTAIRRLLDADPQGLPPADAARRAAVLARRPELAAALDRMPQVRASLTAAMLAAAARQPAADDAAKPRLPGTEDDWRTFADLGATLDGAVAAIAAGRDATPIDFPPHTPAAEIRRRLAPRQLILSFHWTNSGLFGVLESRDRAAFWQVRQVAGLPRELEQFAKSLCLFDPIQPVSTERLAESEWRSSAESIERMLFENSKVTLAEGIDELVIVPDGLLWYLPFELLPVSSNRPHAGVEGGRLLRDCCRIRYCPTRSLAVLRFDAPQGPGPVGVHAGRMFRGDTAEVGAALTARLRAALPGTMPLAEANVPAVPPALVAALCDDLVFFGEVAGEGPIDARPLMPGAGGGMTFGDWLAAPRKRPQRVLVPGFQSAMAGGLHRLPNRPGEDLFAAATDLIAAGAHTALVSRWRMGGRIASDLVAEFLGDVAAPAAAGGRRSAAESWHRAVDLVMAEQPDPAVEPRLKAAPKVALDDGTHPLLWAGYMLLDCGGGTQADEPPRPAGPQAGRPPVPAPQPRGEPR